MAQYKVPQDIEADDKLIGPFSFRQFVYLIVAAGLGFVAFLFFQIFPLLVIIPIPFIIFLIVLALPLKKDQPMETYLSAIVDFYLKPQKRVWMPGQVENTITITAPKKTEDNRTKNLSQEEAGRRLSFLADIVDTEGYAIKDSNLRDDIASEAAATQDIFETSQTFNIDRNLARSTENHLAQVVNQMHTAINSAPTAPQTTEQTTPQPPVISPAIPVAAPTPTPPPAPDIEHNAATILPDMNQIQSLYSQDNPAANALDVALESTDPANPKVEEAKSETEPQPEPIPQPEVTPQPEPAPRPEPAPQPEPDEALKNLANNSDFSVETIAKQAKRLEEKKAKEDGEVYISLH